MMKYFRTNRPCKREDEKFLFVKDDMFRNFDHLSDVENIKKDEGIINLKEKLYSDKRFVGSIIDKFRFSGIELTYDEAEDIMLEYIGGSK